MASLRCRWDGSIREKEYKVTGCYRFPMSGAKRVEIDGGLRVEEKRKAESLYT